MSAVTAFSQASSSSYDKVVRILCCESGEYWRLDDGSLAQQAVSCLVLPEAGDRVRVVVYGQEQFIVDILQRGNTANTAMPLHSRSITIGQPHQSLQIQAKDASLHAIDSLSFGAAGDVDILSAKGALSLSCQTMKITVLGCCIQKIKTSIAHIDDWCVSVKHLLKFHGKRQQITADKEVKIDADVIHMG